MTIRFPLFFTSLSFLPGPWRETRNTVSFGIAIEFDRSSFRFNLRASLKLRAFPTRDRRPVFTGASIPWPDSSFFFSFSSPFCSATYLDFLSVVEIVYSLSRVDRRLRLLTVQLTWFLSRFADCIVLLYPPTEATPSRESIISWVVIAVLCFLSLNGPNLSNYYCCYRRDICNFFLSSAFFVHTSPTTGSHATCV